uniref:Adenylate kinase n=1 Tax=Fervidicoccus fontis TaxID=683846 RepID=A0A7J3ZL11_9CREN
MSIKRNPFKTVIVTGVPGVGKTTVLKEFEKKAVEKNIKLLIVNFGDYMLKAARSEGLAENRDQIRHLPQRAQLRLQGLAAREIVKDALKMLGEEDLLIVDTHSIVKTSSGYWPGLPEHVVRELNPDSIVLIETRAEEVLARQAKDKGRYRQDVGGSVEVIKELMLMARAAAVSSATLTASSVFIVENPPGSPESAAEELLRLVERL